MYNNDDDDDDIIHQEVNTFVSSFGISQQPSPSLNHNSNYNNSSSLQHQGATMNGSHHHVVPRPPTATTNHVVATMMNGSYHHVVRRPPTATSFVTPSINKTQSVVNSSNRSNSSNGSNYPSQQHQEGLGLKETIAEEDGNEGYAELHPTVISALQKFLSSEVETKGGMEHLKVLVNSHQLTL